MTGPMPPFAEYPPVPTDVFLYVISEFAVHSERAGASIVLKRGDSSYTMIFWQGVVSPWQVEKGCAALGVDVVDFYAKARADS